MAGLRRRPHAAGAWRETLMLGRREAVYGDKRCRDLQCDSHFSKRRVTAANGIAIPTDGRNLYVVWGRHCDSLVADPKGGRRAAGIVLGDSPLVTRGDKCGIALWESGTVLGGNVRGSADRRLSRGGNRGECEL